MELFFVTGNENKARELEQMLAGTGVLVKAVKVEVPEIQAKTTQEVASAKASAAADLLQKPVLVDDTGLCLDAMNGLPGPLIRWFVDACGPKKIVDLAGLEPGAFAECALALAVPGSRRVAPKIFFGSVAGRVVSPRGPTHFGWDCIFEPNGHEKTFAEMDASEKNAISHRRIAVDLLKEYLSNTPTALEQ